MDQPGSDQGGATASKADRRRAAAQVRELASMGILPAEQVPARVRMARRAQSQEALQRALDPAVASDPVVVGARAAVLVALALAVLASAVVFAALGAEGAVR